MQSYVCFVHLIVLLVPKLCRSLKEWVAFDMQIVPWPFPGQSKFTSVTTIHRHNLRGAQQNLFIPRPNTEALKKSFRYRGAVTWNSLSAEAKQATTLNSFYSAILH